MANLRPITKGTVLNPKGNNGAEWRARIKREVEAYLVAEKEPDIEKMDQKRVPMVPRYRNTLASIHRAALQGNMPQQQWEMSVLGVSSAAPTRVEMSGPDGAPLPAGTPGVLFVMGDAGTLEDPKGGPPPPATPPPPEGTDPG